MISLFMGLPSSEVVTIIAIQAFSFEENFSAHCLAFFRSVWLCIFRFASHKNPLWRRWSFSPRHFRTQFDNIGRWKSNSFSIPSAVTDNSILAILTRIQDRKEIFNCSSVHLIWESTWFIWYTFLNFLVATIFWPNWSNVGNGQAVGRLAAEFAQLSRKWKTARWAASQKTRPKSKGSTTAWWNRASLWRGCRRRGRPPRRAWRSRRRWCGRRRSRRFPGMWFWVGK